MQHEQKEAAPQPASDAGETDTLAGSWGILSTLPGHPMMWILIVSEILVFGGAFIAFAGTRLADPELFRASQDHLDRLAGAINTMVLLTSGLCAALAVNAMAEAKVHIARRWLAAASALGVVFLAVKMVEYSTKLGAGLTPTANSFFTLYYLTTGFHALHVIAGILILAIVSWKASLETIEIGTTFWHMVDLVWVLLFPVVYLMR
ncbi:MAG: cytochrome c oxidase subunit 3 family protein [Hyphomicrobiaceae bacterium]|nr:cytochrome c oxidase subunit 3 family protein [Hyphomicrobiaceae bacterium]